MKIRVILLFVLSAAVVLLALLAKNWLDERKTLAAMIERLSADSRAAEALVAGVRAEPDGSRSTTIKFVEYDTRLRPLAPKYFTFRGNIIQFQSLVIRFDDSYVRKGDPLRGKSVYLFLKAFSLSPVPEVYEITPAREIPEGYKVAGRGGLQGRLWRSFWRYALDGERAKRAGVKNAQIEAPGTMFVPGVLYTLKIEHDGGLRIDASPLPRDGGRNPEKPGL